MNQTTKPVIEERERVAPAVNVRESEGGYTLTAALPGVAEEAVQLTVEDRTLVLDAENDCAPPSGYTVLRQEIPARHYRAVFELPDRVDAGAITCALRHGMLTVTLPKREEVKPRRVSVAVS